MAAIGGVTSGSRYAVSGSNNPFGFGNNVDNVVSANENASQSGQQSSVSTNQQAQTGTTNQTQNSKQTTKNMSPATMQALEQLIRQLQAGGTPEMQAQAATRRAILDSTLQQQQGYSKEAAFGDAQGLISQQMRRALESLLPSINRAAEDAGSSGGALRALLLQDAANKATESSSAAGLQAAVNYGNINTNYAQVLEALSRQDPKATEMLLNALNISKGAVQQTSGTVNTVGTSTSASTSTGTQNQSSSQQSSGNKQQTTDYAPFSVSAPASTSPIYFGPSQPTVDPGKFVGTTMDTLAQLAGGGSPWASYNF